MSDISNNPDNPESPEFNNPTQELPPPQWEVRGRGNKKLGTVRGFKTKAPHAQKEAEKLARDPYEIEHIKIIPKGL